MARAAPAPAQTRVSQPNIVVFVADDLGWRDLGIYGNAGILPLRNTEIPPDKERWGR